MLEEMTLEIVDEGLGKRDAIIEQIHTQKKKALVLCQEVHWFIVQQTLIENPLYSGHSYRRQA